MSVGTLDIFSSHTCGKETKAKETATAGLVSIFATLHTWMERARTRRELAKLNDHMLSDIGLTRADVVNELDKPFWVK